MLKPVSSSMRAPWLLRVTVHSCSMPGVCRARVCFAAKQIQQQMKALHSAQVQLRSLQRASQVDIVSS